MLLSVSALTGDKQVACQGNSPALRAVLMGVVPNRHAPARLRGRLATRVPPPPSTPWWQETCKGRPDRLQWRGQLALPKGKGSGHSPTFFVAGGRKLGNRHEHDGR